MILAVQACGSDDGKKKARQVHEAGAGGEGGETPAAGGSAAGAPVGTAGEAPVPQGGVGGEAPVPMTGGAAGEPTITPPDPELLFSVKPGAAGLTDSALAKNVSDDVEPSNFIYTSKTGSQDAVNGTNGLKITGESLGLAPTDQIVAFAVAQTEPAHPTYLFSIAEGSEGADTTRSYVSYWQEGQTGPGDVYYSDGTQSFRDYGEGGDPMGYNAMLATELSLGLSQGDGTPDDLTGLAVHDANQPITELYFTVAAGAEGAADSAVATIGPDERSCTVFKSSLDGTNSVAFSCDALGLAVAGADSGADQIDALAVYGTDAPTSVVFSVTNGALGAAGSEVEATSQEGRVGCTLFQSPGDGSNAVLREPHDLGLGEYVDDEIDGIAVIDAPSPKVVSAATCQLTYDPFDATNGAGLTYSSGVSRLGSGLLVMFGQTDSNARLLAYDAKTCANVGQVDLPLSLGNAGDTAIVPLAGWSAAAPFENVEYLRLTTDSQGLAQAVLRYDDTGAFVKEFPIVGTYYYYSVDRLVYSPATDQLYMMLDEYGYHTMRVAARPDAATTDIDVPVHYRTHPCGYQSGITGTDSAGNLYLAAPQDTVGDYRVCAFTPGGELLPQPYWWTQAPSASGSGEGYIVPGQAYFLLHQADGAYSIERGALQAP